MHAFSVTFLIMQIVALTLEIVQLSYYSLALWHLSPLSVQTLSCMGPHTCAHI